MPETDAENQHVDQKVPLTWNAVEFGDHTLVIHDPAENGATAYVVSTISRNVRTFARADAALYEGKVVEPVYDEDTRTVEFYHNYAGRVGRASVAEFFEEPAVRLKRLPGLPDEEVLQA